MSAAGSPSNLIRQCNAGARLRIHRGAPLWSLVSEITQQSSEQAKATCRELGWNPEAKVGEQDIQGAA